MSLDSPQTISVTPETRHDEILPVRISLVTSASGFDALSERWNDLLDRSDARVFQTFEWQRTWWKHFGESRNHRQLYIIALWAGTTVIGIAPFFVERVTVLGPVRYRRLSFIGRGTSDYLDVIVARGHEDAVYAQLAHHLMTHRDEFDVVLLEDIHDGSPSHGRIPAALREAGFSGDQFLSEYCPRTALRPTWEETVKTFPSSNRNRLVKRMRVVTEEFHAAFERIVDSAEVAPAMDDFISMHQARWNVIGHQGVFACRTTHEFHRDVAPLLMNRGWLFLAFLRMNGERFAGDYGLLYRNECLTYLGGAYDAGEVNRHSPGTVLLMGIMRECHSMGVTVYDFLRGTERYKYTLGAVDIPNWTVLMFSRKGRTAPLLHRTHLLREALERRSAHEWTRVAHHAQKSGVFSLAFASYLVRRCGTIVADALQKARKPEKSLIIGREEQ